MVSLQPKLNLKVSQRQILTPGLMQMVSVLALNKLELKDMIQTEIAENPVLEELEESVPMLDHVVEPEQQQTTAEERAQPDPFEEIDFGSYFQEYLDPGFRSPQSFEINEKPSLESYLSKAGSLQDHLCWQIGSLSLSDAVRDATEYIIGNLNEDGYLLATEEELLEGYQAQTAAYPVAEAEADGGAPVAAGRAETLTLALSIVRGLDPVGVASRDLRECLLTQVQALRAEFVARERKRAKQEDREEREDREAERQNIAFEDPSTRAPGYDDNGHHGTSAWLTGEELESALHASSYAGPVHGELGQLSANGHAPTPHAEPLSAAKPPLQQKPPADPQLAIFDLAARIIDKYLLLLQKRDLRELARNLGSTVEQAQVAFDFIRTLDPRPGQRFNPVDARLIEPDVAFVKRDDEYVAVMDDEGVPTLHVNQGYRRLLKQASAEKEVKDYVKERYRSALQLMRNIDQRKNTILRTCEVIVRRQQEFLEHGVEALRPMMIKEVAEEIGVHPSTVSRAVSNKYVHTPQGVFELRFFFSEGVNGPEGSGTPLLLLKRKVKKLIEDEDPRKPLTDDLITHMLQSQGIDVTRRTVAKYREDLRIPSTHQRRVRD